jgi:hypothetical protein
MATEFFTREGGLPPALPLFHSVADASAHGFVEFETHIAERFDRTRRVFQVVRRRRAGGHDFALLQVHS